MTTKTYDFLTSTFWTFLLKMLAAFCDVFVGKRTKTFWRRIICRKLRSSSLNFELSSNDVTFDLTNTWKKKGEYWDTGVLNFFWVASLGWWRIAQLPNNKNLLSFCPKKGNSLLLTNEDIHVMPKSHSNYCSNKETCKLWSFKNNLSSAGWETLLNRYGSNLTSFYNYLVLCNDHCWFLWQASEPFWFDASSRSDAGEWRRKLQGKRKQVEPNRTSMYERAWKWLKLFIGAQPYKSI